MTSKLTSTGVMLLAALRAAAVLQREPGVLTPDGHEHFFTIAELENEGRLDGIADMARLSSAMRGLYKHRYVAVRTQFTVSRWAITGDGLLALAGIEAAAGVSGVVSAQLEYQQALYDLDRAAANVVKTEDALNRAQAAAGRPAHELVMEVLAR